MFSVCVIIPVYRRENVFKTVTDVRRFAAPETGLRFLVIDNGNASPLREKLLTLAAPDVEILRLEKNLGGAGAYRAGMEKAVAEKADFLWLLDDDAEPDENTLPELLAAYRELTGKDVDVGAVSGVVIDANDRETVTECGADITGAWGKLTLRHHGKNVRELRGNVVECDYVAATSMLIPGRVAEKVGAFAPIFIHFDDIEWCFRARKNGFPVWATERSQVFHPVWKENFANWLYYYNTRNRLWFLKKYRKRQYFICLPLLFLRAVFLYLRGKRAAGKLIFAGIHHAFSGKLWLRDEVEKNIAS